MFTTHFILALHVTIQNPQLPFIVLNKNIVNTGEFKWMEDLTLFIIIIFSITYQYENNQLTQLPRYLTVL